jgi:hypothetical protein
MITYSVSYVIFNFWYTKTKGKPIYKVFSWETYASYILGLILVLVHLGIFLGFNLMTQKKLKYYGHHDFLKDINSKKDDIIVI